MAGKEKYVTTMDFSDLRETTPATKVGSSGVGLRWRLEREPGGRPLHKEKDAHSQGRHLTMRAKEIKWQQR